MLAAGCRTMLVESCIHGKHATSHHDVWFHHTCSCIQLSNTPLATKSCGSHHLSKTTFNLFCRHGFAARYLIEQGADPFVQDKTYQRSAIHYAAARGKVDALRRLVDDNLCIHTEDGFVPLKSARIQDVSGNCRYCQAATAYTSLPGG